MKKLLKVAGILVALSIGAFISYTVGYYTATHQPVQSAPVATVVSPPSTKELLDLVNSERAKAGVAPLKEDARLDKSAQQKADDMFLNSYFDHVDKNGRHGYDIAHEYAPDICRLPSENIVTTNDKSQISSSQAMEWWISSKPHYDAMVNPKYTYTGFGINNYLIVEHFC